MNIFRFNVRMGEEAYFHPKGHSVIPPSGRNWYRKTVPWLRLSLQSRQGVGKAQIRQTAHFSFSRAHESVGSATKDSIVNIS